jgi:hypothetical protein
MPEMTPPETMMYFIVAPAGGGRGMRWGVRVKKRQVRQQQPSHASITRAVAHGKKSAAPPLRGRQRQQPRRV